MTLKNLFNKPVLILIIAGFMIYLYGCNTFSYKTYDPKEEETTDDPEPNYDITLNEEFQDYTNYMFPGNRIENFVTYFNTFYNARTDYDDAYDEYMKKNLEGYSEKIDSAFNRPQLSQETIDKFNKAIEKCSKVLQFHKSSDFLDDAVLMIGKSYFYLGDYLKAERKFGEFISKLSRSSKYEEAILFLSRSELRLNKNTIKAVERLNSLIANTNDNSIRAESYRSLAEYNLSIKDYQSAIKNFKSSVQNSKDDEFKAQMQYIISAIIAKDNPGTAALEFMNVMDYSPTYHLEYLSNYNHVKNNILGNRLTNISGDIENLQVKYKDDPAYLPELDLLEARYKYQKKDHIAALSSFKNVIRKYPQTTASSNAAFYIADYYEHEMKDLLNAYRFYRFSAEQSSMGTNRDITNNKIKVLKRYFELKSGITETTINTDYSQEIIDLTKKPGEENQEIIPGKEFEKERGQGYSGRDDEDSVLIKAQMKANMMFEMAELFIYDMVNTDSAEYYLKNAHEISNDYDFKSKTLFALATLYSNTGNNEKSNAALKEIIDLYPASIVSNEARKMLNIPLIESSAESTTADSIYKKAQDALLIGNYELAMNGFRQIISDYPTTPNAEKSYYAAGWLFENVYYNADSAFYYYNKITELNPYSSFGAVLFEKLTEYTSSKNPDTNKVNENKEQEIDNKQEEIQPQSDPTEENKEKQTDIDIKTNDEAIEEEKPDVRKKENDGDN